MYVHRETSHEISKALHWMQFVAADNEEEKPSWLVQCELFWLQTSLHCSVVEKTLKTSALRTHKYGSKLNAQTSALLNLK